MLSPASVPASAPLLGVLLLAVFVNWPTLHDYFHGDDYLAFVDMVSKPWLKHFSEVLTFKDTNYYWRPLGEVYFFVIWKLFGLNEVAFHVANITVFLITLALLYTFCVRAGLGWLVAAGACAFLTLFPNHVVSVAWITNGPRLLAVMFALASLVLLQKALSDRSPRLEALSFLTFALAGLSDETALSLAPLGLAYALMVEHQGAGWLKRSALRAVPYACLALSLVPLQFIATEGNPGFVNKFRFGDQMLQHFWALMSKLVWPSKDSIAFAEIAPGQWLMGAMAIALLLLALAFGSNRLRFLCLWVILALAPFTIWLNPIAPSRYVYMAAVPFAVIASWALVRAVDWLCQSVPGSFVTRDLRVSTAVMGMALVALAFSSTFGLSVTRERNQTFASDTETYRILAEGLKASAPTVPDGARIVIYYGIWNTFYIWPDAVAKTIYRDPKIHVLNIPRGQVETGSPGRGPKDIVLFYTGKGFIRSAPLKSATVN